VQNAPIRDATEVCWASWIATMPFAWPWPSGAVNNEILAMVGEHEHLTRNDDSFGTNLPPKSCPLESASGSHVWDRSLGRVRSLVGI